MHARLLPFVLGGILLTAAACGDTVPVDNCSALCGEHASGCINQDGETHCVCEIGYTGERCEACAEGYQEAAGSCVKPPECGDGLLGAGEDCDDGNVNVGDGCDGACFVEAGWSCDGEPSVCEALPYCGDGSLDPGEDCDDGGDTPGDGCSASCDVESGWTCTGVPSTCTRLAACGDGTIDVGEGCDDGNRTAGDGCSDGCNVESGWTCAGEPSDCTLDPVCGNGSIEGTEVCDDGNTAGGDGCDGLCAVEGGWTCTGQPSDCTLDPVCGNGLVENGETCDDGGTSPGDGCDGGCAVEPGWNCNGEPSRCEVPAFCGDGIVDSDEDCDDGAAWDGDGCSSGCSVEGGWSCAGEPSVCEAIPNAPTIEGEASAGHRDPTWLWTIPTGTFSFRISLDGGSEQAVPATVTDHTATNLPDGQHTFRVRACNSQDGCSSAASFTTTVRMYTTNAGYWTGVQKSFPKTPIGNVAAICRHNAYDDGGSNSAISLSGTKGIIDAAIADNADLIELDIKENAGVLYVDHDETGTNGALLSDVLDYAPLQSDDALLYIEVKESSSHATTARRLLDMLNARRQHFARNGRPVVIRTFHNRLANLTEVQAILDDYPLMKHYVRLHVLFSGNQTTDMAAYHGLIRDAKTRGLDGIEFPYTDENILSKAAYAHDQGLSVTAWTIPASFGEAFLSALRNEVDALVVEYDVSDARSVVSDRNQLIYLNVWDQPSTGSSVSWHRTGSITYAAHVGGTNEPTLMSDGPGEDRFGTSLVFDDNLAQRLSFYDADTYSGQGYLLTAYVNFDDLLTSCPGGGTTCTMAVFNKSEAGGFALELRRDSSGRRLRFGVHISGSYEYAEIPLSSLNGTNGYLVTGAYDGNGGVYIWVDNGNRSSGGTFTGGVTNNSVDAILGADPQDASAPRYFLSAKVQMVQLLRWADH